MLLCAILYSGNFLSYVIDSSAIVSKLWLLRPVGVTLFLVSMFVGFLVTVVAENRQDLDIEEISRRNLADLNDRVSKNLG